MSSYTNNLRSRLNSLVSQRKEANASLLRETKELALVDELISNTQQAQSYAQQIAEEIQNQVHKQIARIVSKCLSAVFEEPYELRIEMEKRRGRTEVEFVYLRNGYKVSPRVTSGGVRNVTSLALRIASLMVCNPPRRKFIALDEPFHGVDTKNLTKMGSLISSLSEDLNLQVFIITHDPVLEVGKVIQL